MSRCIFLISKIRLSASSDHTLNAVHHPTLRHINGNTHSVSRKYIISSRTPDQTRAWRMMERYTRYKQHKWALFIILELTSAYSGSRRYRTHIYMSEYIEVCGIRQIAVSRGDERARWGVCISIYSERKSCREGHVEFELQEGHIHIYTHLWSNW